MLVGTLDALSFLVVSLAVGEASVAGAVAFGVTSTVLHDVFNSNHER